MPTIPLPPGERLLITIDREVSVECDSPCHSADEFQADQLRKAKAVSKTYAFSTEDARILRGCPHCDDTGHIKRSVRGWCEIRVYAKGILVKNWIEENDSWHGSYTAREMVVAACLDGTLPDEIAANIEITDIEESA